MNVIVTGLPDHDEIMDLMANYSQATGDLKINYIMFQNTLCLDIALIEKKQISKIKCLCLAWWRFCDLSNRWLCYLPEQGFKSLVLDEQA